MTTKEILKRLASDKRFWTVVAVGMGGGAIARLVVPGGAGELLSNLLFAGGIVFAARLAREAGGAS